MRTMHTLEEVAQHCLPPHWTDSVRWLARRLNRGELQGTRFGRSWMMSDSDVDYLIQKHHNVTAPIVERHADLPAAVGSVSFLEGLSDRSRSRLRRQSA